MAQPALTPAPPRWVMIMLYIRLVLVIVTLALVAYAFNRIMAVFGVYWSSHVLLFFTCVWTMIMSIYEITTIHISKGYSPYFATGLELLSCIFWLVAWAILAIWAGRYKSALEGTTLEAVWGAVAGAAAISALVWVLTMAIGIGFSIYVFRRVWRKAKNHHEMGDVGHEPKANEYPQYTAGVQGSAPYQQPQYQPQQSNFAPPPSQNYA